MALDPTPAPLKLSAMRVTNGIPLECSLLLPVDTVNSVQTLKGGGHHYNFSFWEVLNEPNLYQHYQQLPSAIATYTRVYDGITTVLYQHHPHLQFAAMCWAGITLSDFAYFFNQSNHHKNAPWPPAYVTFHIYASPAQMFGPSLTGSLTAAAEVVALVKQRSNQTKVCVSPYP
jgi:hypothetical protein